MTEPDIEKKRVRHGRSARVYVRPDLLTPEELDQRLAIVAHYFPGDVDTDDDDDGNGTPAVSVRTGGRRSAKPDAVKRRVSQSERKRLAREGKAVVGADGHVSYPIETAEDLHNAAVLARTGHGDVEAARRLIARRSKELGVKNPLDESAEKHMANPGNPVMPSRGRSLADARVSEPVTEGHQASSTGDHGVGMSRSDHIAWDHPDLRQHSTTIEPFAELHTVNGVTIGSLAFQSGRVNVSRLDAYNSAGAPQFREQPSGNPVRPDYHQHRDSATPPNGSHSLANPTSHAVKAAPMTNSELRAEFKRKLFPGGGGGR